MVDVTTLAVLLTLTTPFSLTVVGIVTIDVDEEVQDPSHKLLTNEGPSSFINEEGLGTREEGRYVGIRHLQPYYAWRVLQVVLHFIDEHSSRYQFYQDILRQFGCSCGENEPYCGDEERADGLRMLAGSI